MFKGIILNPTGHLEYQNVLPDHLIDDEKKKDEN